MQMADIRLTFDTIAVLTRLSIERGAYGDDTPTCLTSAQVATARAIYAPATMPRTGQVIYPGLLPGSELGWALLAGSRPLSSPVEFFQNVVFKDRNWDYQTLNFSTDVARAEKGDAGVGDANDANLQPFFSHGGKIIQYHGWSDNALSPQYSIDYYTRVAGNAGSVKREGYRPPLQQIRRERGLRLRPPPDQRSFR